MSEKHSWKIEEIFLVLVFFAIPFDRALKIAKIADTTFISLTKLLILGAMVGWVVRSLLARNPELFTVPFKRATTVLLVAFLFVSFLSIYNLHSYGEYAKEMIQRVNLVVFPLLVVGIVKSRKLLGLVVGAMLLGSVIASLAGVYEMVTHKAIIAAETRGREELTTTPEGSIRIQGFSGDSDNHVSNMVLFFGLGMSMLFLARTRKLQAAILLLLVLLFINIIGSASRGGMLAFLACVFVFFVFLKMRWKFLIAGSAVAAMLAVYVLIAVSTEVATLERFTGESFGGTSITFREGHLRTTFAMAADHPIIGVGVGGFIEETHRYKYRAGAAEDLPEVAIDIHMPFFGVIAEMGIIGFTVFLALILSVATELFLTIRNRDDNFASIMAMGVLSSFVGFIALLCFMPSFSNEIGWLMMALAVILAGLRLEGAATEALPAELQASS
jgi:hypothetical protein